MIAALTAYFTAKPNGETRKPRVLLKITGLLWIFLILDGMAQTAPKTSAPPSPTPHGGPSQFLIIDGLGESDHQIVKRNAELLSMRRATDPFGINIRGPFKGLPPVAEHNTGKPQAGTPGLPALPIILPTLEKAVEELNVGAVNVASHEILIGSRVVKEGDLLVLQSDGQQFTVWLQSVQVSGLFFCDPDFLKHPFKPFGSVRPLHSDPTKEGTGDLQHFLTKGTNP
jgi:hypothetical protein